MTQGTRAVPGWTPWATGTVLLVLAAVALYFFTGEAASEPSRSQPPQANDITFGPRDAGVVVIEYSDFQCPFCALYSPIMKTLREQYGDRVLFVFRFFPLSTHEYATVAAKAAYAAHLRGKFWEMHDLLFERQDEWVESPDPRTVFDTYAQSLGLDLDRFHADMDDPATTGFITRQAEEGTRAGVTHTPWFVVGDSVVLPRSLEEFQKLIEAEL